MKFIAVTTLVSEFEADNKEDAKIVYTEKLNKSLLQNFNSVETKYHIKNAPKVAKNPAKTYSKIIKDFTKYNGLIRIEGPFSQEFIFSNKVKCNFNHKKKSKLAREDFNCVPVVIGGEEHKLLICSSRYDVFEKDNCTCVVCGLKGIHFYMEVHALSECGHFNLYGHENGYEILFTKDHIVPASKKGPNRLENYQTMCIICNRIKANHDMTAEQILDLRKDFNFQNVGRKL